MADDYSGFTITQSSVSPERAAREFVRIYAMHAETITFSEVAIRVLLVVSILGAIATIAVAVVQLVGSIL